MSRADAMTLVDCGKYIIVSNNSPLIVRFASEYDEERKHLSGYLVNRTYPEPLSAYDLKRLRLRQQEREYKAAGSNRVAEAREFRSRRPRAAEVEA